MPNQEIPMSMPVGDVQMRAPIATFPSGGFPITTTISDMRAATAAPDRVPSVFGPGPVIDVAPPAVADARPVAAPVDATPPVDAPKVQATPLENPLSTPSSWDKSLPPVDLESRPKLEGSNKVTLNVSALKEGETADVLIKANGEIKSAPNLTADLAHLNVRYEEGTKPETVQNALKELKENSLADKQVTINASEEAKKMVPDTLEADLNKPTKPGDLDDAPQKRSEEGCSGGKCNGGGQNDRPPNHMPDETNTPPENKDAAVQKEVTERAAAQQARWDAADTNIQNLGGFKPETYGQMFYGMFPSSFWDELSKAMTPPPGDPAKIKALMDKFEVSKKLGEMGKGLDDKSQAALTGFGDKLKSLGTQEGLTSPAGQEFAQNLQKLGTGAATNSPSEADLNKVFDTPALKKALDHAVVMDAINKDANLKGKVNGDITNLSAGDMQTVLARLVKQTGNTDVAVIPSAF